MKNLGINKLESNKSYPIELILMPMRKRVVNIVNQEVAEGQPCWNNICYQMTKSRMTI